MYIYKYVYIYVYRSNNYVMLLMGLYSNVHVVNGHFATSRYVIKQVIKHFGV